MQIKVLMNIKMGGGFQLIFRERIYKDILNQNVDIKVLAMRPE
jgi:hypothetical protein